MATSWRIGEQIIVGVGPIWDLMSTDVTHDYDELTSHYWDWSRDWTISAKISSDTGIVWSAVSHRWQDDPTIYKKNPWTVMNITKFQEATET